MFVVCILLHFRVLAMPAWFAQSVLPAALLASVRGRSGAADGADAHRHGLKRMTPPPPLAHVMLVKTEKAQRKSLPPASHFR